MIDGNKWLFVSGVLSKMQKQSDRHKAAIDGLLIAPESPLLEPQAWTEGNLIEALSYLVGDDFDNLSWFVYDCDYGRDPKEAGCEGHMKLIDSHDRIRWLIELDCET